jgi:hypothetical protein
MNAEQTAARFKRQAEVERIGKRIRVVSLRGLEAKGLVERDSGAHGGKRVENEGTVTDAPRGGDGRRYERAGQTATAKRGNKIEPLDLPTESEKGLSPMQPTAEPSTRARKSAPRGAE